MKKTVFFGPFFGELGWEFAYWHGWVRKMCKEKYQSYRKIAASYPGREPFYPDVDEFWSHPSEISKLKISQRGYASDFWMDNLPEADNSGDADRNISQYAERLFQEYQKKLPADTIFYIPHKLNVYRLGGKQYLIGTLWLKGLSFYKTPKTLSAILEHQTFENLGPTKEGIDFLNKIVNPNHKIIALFPRHRSSRRPDKSWPRENYDLLIEYLKKQYPNHAIGILGAPGGCYYADVVPSDCIDLINIPEELRLDVHLAALKRADIAIGSLSGAMRIAYASGCPTVEWGYPIVIKNVKTYNCWAPFLDRRYIFWPEINPSVEKVKELVDLMMTNEENKVVYPSVSVTKDSVWNYGWTLPSRVLRELVARPYLRLLKRKKLKEGVINNFILIQ